MVPKGLYVKVLREGVILPCMLNSSNLFSHIVVILPCHSSMYIPIIIFFYVYLFSYYLGSHEYLMHINYNSHEALILTYPKIV